MTRTLLELLDTGQGSIKTGPFGTILSASEYSTAGVPIVSVGEVGYGRLLLRPDTPMASTEVVERLPEYILAEGDIVVARKGAVDRSARVGVAEAGWFLGSDGLRIRPGAAVDSSWLAYYLSSKWVREWLLRHAAGTTMLSLSGATLGDIPVSPPPRRNQVAIAAVLGALDSKIAANCSLIDTIEALIDMSSEQILARAKTRVPISSLASFVKGVSYRRGELAPSSVAMVSLKSITRSGRYSSEGLKSFTGRFRDEQAIAPGGIVIAQTDLTQGAEVIGRAVRVPPTDGYSQLVASLDLVIARPVLKVPYEYLLGVLRQSKFREHCRSHSSGTTVLHLGRGTIDSYQAPLLSEEAQVGYAQHVQPFLMRLDAAHRETRLLIELRDTFLPALMSGRLRVKDAERQVEDAV